MVMWFAKSFCLAELRGPVRSIQSGGAPPHSRTQAGIELSKTATFWSAALLRRFGLPGGRFCAQQWDMKVALGQQANRRV